jgi:hypothetical protein
MKLYTCHIPTDDGIPHTNCLLVCDSELGLPDACHALVSPVDLLAVSGIVKPSELSLIFTNECPPVTRKFRIDGRFPVENGQLGALPPYAYSITFI